MPGPGVCVGGGAQALRLQPSRAGKELEGKTLGRECLAAFWFGAVHAQCLLLRLPSRPSPGAAAAPSGPSERAAPDELSFLCPGPSLRNSLNSRRWRRPSASRG